MSQDTFYVGTIKGVGRIYEEAVIDTYTRVAFANLYDRKNTGDCRYAQRSSSSIL